MDIRAPGAEAIEGFVRAGINANWLVTGQGEMLVQQPAEAVATPQHSVQDLPASYGVKEQRTGYVAIPLFNDIRAAAGYGAISTQENADDALMFKEEWIRGELGARPEDLNLIRVSGDSMEPTLRGGDVVLIDHRACRPNREGIYILRLGDMLLVKRLQALPGNEVRVISDNPTFAPWQISLDKIGSEMTIIGRVVWSGRRH
jgi:phage repressor protein C with HTH and peptisase S24 domain